MNRRQFLFGSVAAAAFAFVPKALRPASSAATLLPPEKVEQAVGSYEEMIRSMQEGSIHKVHVDVLPEWATAFINNPSRYKVAYGGRGGGKRWFFERYLIERCARQKTKAIILYKSSIVSGPWLTRAFSEMIKDAGYADHFGMREFNDSHAAKVGAFSWSTIYGRNGSAIYFLNIQDDDPRDWEDIDIVLTVDAQRLTKRDVNILFPSIRKKGSELWFTFNPQRRTDPVYEAFVDPGTRLDNAIVRKVNYYDNPWFPKEMETERVRMAFEEPERYSHVWLGELDEGELWYSASGDIAWKM